MKITWLKKDDDEYDIQVDGDLIGSVTRDYKGDWSLIPQFPYDPMLNRLVDSKYHEASKAVNMLITVWEVFQEELKSSMFGPPWDID